MCKNVVSVILFTIFWYINMIYALNFLHSSFNKMIQWTAEIMSKAKWETNIKCDYHAIIIGKGSNLMQAKPQWAPIWKFRHPLWLMPKERDKINQNNVGNLWDIFFSKLNTEAPNKSNIFIFIFFILIRVILNYYHRVEKKIDTTNISFIKLT